MLVTMVATMLKTWKAANAANLLPVPCAGEILAPDEVFPDQLPVNGAKVIFDEKTAEEEVAEEGVESDTDSVTEWQQKFG